MGTPADQPLVQEIPINKIVPSPFQTRKNFDPVKLQELAQTIKDHGLMNPINVRPVGDGYELIAGERRLEASKLLNSSTIEAKVEAIDDAEAAERVLIENIQREQMFKENDHVQVPENPQEEAELLKRAEAGPGPVYAWLFGEGGYYAKRSKGLSWQDLGMSGSKEGFHKVLEMARALKQFDPEKFNQDLMKVLGQKK